MALSDDLSTYVKGTFNKVWEENPGKVVPEPESLTSGNDAIVFDRATILYADLSGSTAMVDGHIWYLSAEVYKSFLYCAARLITRNDGTIPPAKAGRGSLQ